MIFTIHFGVPLFLETPIYKHPGIPTTIKTMGGKI